MPRKTLWTSPAAARFRRFNEAAARCRGKRRRPLFQGVLPARASMRPRPDAAENARALAGRVRVPWRFNEAAARCRGKRPRSWGFLPGQGEASMRPRPDAAENTKTVESAAARSNGFNEAAARCRGKRRAVCTVWPSPSALQ